MTEPVKKNWAKFQAKTLLNWVNNKLRGNLRSDPTVTGQVKDLTTDLQDGLLLIRLAEACVKPKKIKRYNKKPLIKIQKLENIICVFRFFESDGTKFVNIGPEDIYNGNDKLICGFIWTLIQKYQFRLSNRKLSPKKVMLDWLKALMPEVPVTNFSTDWNSGVVLCALVDHIGPGLCPNYASLNPNDGEANCRLGVELAERSLKVPPVLEPRDLAHPLIDEMSVMTYVSCFCDPYAVQLLDWLRKTLPDVPIANFSTDWNNGVALAALVDSMSPGLFPDHATLPKARALQNCTRAMDLAAERLGVAKLLAPSELTDPKVDQLLVMTYLTQYQTATLQALAKQCRAVGLATRIKSGVGVRVKFQIDTSGSGEGKVETIVTRGGGGAGGGDVVPVTMETSPEDDRIYDVSFPVADAGIYVVDVRLNDDSIAGMPRDVNAYDATRVFFASALKPNVAVGERCDFVVDTSKAGAGGGTLEIRLTDENTGLALKADVVEETDHVHAASFAPTDVGVVTVHVTWEGDDVAGSPFRIGVFNAERVRAYGEGLLSGEGKTGQVVAFNVSTESAGEAKLAVEVTGQQAVYPVEIKQREATEYEVAFQPWKVGAHEVEIAWGGRPIPRSPFPLQITGQQCDVTGVPTSSIIGEPIAFAVDVSRAGDVAVGVLVTGPRDGVAKHVEPDSQADGLYKFSHVPDQIGSHAINVTLDRQPAPAGPFVVNVVDPSCCAFLAPPPSSVHVDRAQTLRVTTRGGGGGDGDGTDALAVRIHSSRSKIAIPFDVTVAADSTSSITFTPTTVDLVDVDVTWHGRHIPSSPVSIHVCDSSKVKISGGDLLSGVGKTGQPVSFRVETKDAGDGRLHVEPRGPTAVYPVDIKDADENEPGTKIVTFTPWQVGEHAIDVKLGGESVPHSPFAFAVTGVQCTVTGVPKMALIDQTIEFELDVSGSGDVRVDVATRSPSGETSVVPLEKRVDGKYDGVFVPTEAGEYYLEVSLDREPIGSGPICVKVVDAALCKITPPPPSAYRVGVPQTLIVDGRSAGAGALGVRIVTLKDKTAVPFVVAETEERGVWQIDFTPSGVDTLSIDVKWSGRHVASSPLTIPIYDPALARVDGAELRGGKGKVGRRVHFTVDVSDAGSVKPEVTAAGPTAFQAVQMTRRDDGVYAVDFVPWEPGDHRVSVRLGDDEVTSSPFEMDVERSIDARTVVATGDGTRTAYIDAATSFEFQTTQSGLLDVEGAIACTLQGVRSSVDVQVEDLGDGKYRGTYAPQLAGAYLLLVRLFGVDVPGSPFKVTVYVKADATKCRVERGDALASSGILVGKPVSFRVGTQDAGVGKIVVVVTSPRGRVVRVYSAEEDDGFVSYRFDTDEPGRYSVRVTWSGDDVPGSPFKVKVWPPPDAGQVRVEGPGLHDCNVGDVGEFTIDAKDAGLGTLLVRVHGIKDAFKIKLKSGVGGDARVVRATYDPKEPGDYIIVVKWEDVEVPGSPFEVKIRDPNEREEEENEAGERRGRHRRRRRNEREEDAVLYNPSEPDIYKAAESNKQYRIRSPRRKATSPPPPPAVAGAPVKRQVTKPRSVERRHISPPPPPATSAKGGGVRRTKAATTPDPVPLPAHVRQEKEKKRRKSRRSHTEPVPVQQENWSFGPSGAVQSANNPGGVPGVVASGRKVSGDRGQEKRKPKKR